MTFIKKVVNSDAGDADHVGGNDWDTLDNYFDNINIGTTAIINTTTRFKDDKLAIRNPADTFSYVISSGAITAARVMSLPVVTGDDTFAVLGLAQDFNYTGAMTRFRRDDNADILAIYKATSTNGDSVTFNFQLNDTGSNAVNYARIVGQAIDTTNGSEDGKLQFLVRIADVLTAVGEFTETGKFTCGGANRRIVLDESGLTAQRTITFPDTNALMVGLTTTQSPTNKTFDQTNLINTDYWRRRPELYSDFLRESAGGTAPFDPLVAGNGTLATIAGDAEHPGVIRATSGTTLNSGYMLRASTNAVTLGGGEQFECVMRFPGFTNNTVRIGFHDTTTNAAPADGVYFEMSGSSTVSGKATSNSSTTTTGTTFTASTATWYRLKITITSTSRADFFIYDMSGSQLFTNNVTTNIPNGAGRDCGICAIGTNSTTTGGIDVLDLDYMAVFPAETGLLTR